jgi:hypothetical protein
MARYAFYFVVSGPVGTGSKKIEERNLQYERVRKIQTGVCEMTKVRCKGPIGGFSGSMDGMVFADNGERTVAYIRKERKGEKSEAELERDENWAEARAYANSVKASNPELWELYRQVGRERKVSPFALAVGDYLKPPALRPLNLKDYKGQVGDPDPCRGQHRPGLGGGLH